jgi:hypothetical protein
VVPLVFKTSLGAVRFPEGSTPSLLRQISLTPHRGSSANAFRSRAVHGTRCENDEANLASLMSHCESTAPTTLGEHGRLLWLKRV